MVNLDGGGLLSLEPVEAIVRRGDEVRLGRGAARAPAAAREFVDRLAGSAAPIEGLMLRLAAWRYLKADLDAARVRAEDGRALAGVEAAIGPLERGRSPVRIFRRRFSFRRPFR